MDLISEETKQFTPAKERVPLASAISLCLFYVIFFCHFIFHSFTENLKCFPVNIKNPLVSLASNITMELGFTSLDGPI